MTSFTFGIKCLEVDRVCWVLDPDPPTPRDLYRYSGTQHTFTNYDLHSV